MPDPMAEARIRAQSSWYRDGLSDILIGIIVLLQNGFTLIMHFGNRQSSWYWPVILAYLLLFFVFSASAPRVMAAMRERITYPRVGYSQPGDAQRRLSRAVAILTIFGFILAICYGRWDTDHWIQGLPVVVGLLFCVVGMCVAVRYGVLRYLLIGLFSIILGLAVDIEHSRWLGLEI